MLAFAVYQNGVPLDKWPELIASRAYCAYLADGANRPRERAFDFDYGRLAACCAPDAERRLFLRYPVRGFGDPVLRTRLLPSGPAPADRWRVSGRLVSSEYLDFAFANGVTVMV